MQTLCDDEFFSLTLFNLDLNKFEVFRNDHEWVVDFKVIFEPNIKLLSKRTMPSPILKLLEKAKEKRVDVLVAKNWATNLWLLYSDEKLHTFDSELHSYPFKYSNKISAFFYSPLDSQFYAISGQHVRPYNTYKNITYIFIFVDIHRLQWHVHGRV